MENLTREDSLNIIQTVINQRKKQYEEKGSFLLFWGALVMVAGITQFIMLQMGKGEFSDYVWLFTMIPGGIITFISKFREGHKKASKKESTDLHGWTWLMAGTLAMLTGFIFGDKFGCGFTAAIYLPFCIAAMASALSLKNWLWVILTILGTIFTYSSVFIEAQYHPLISAVVASLILLIPGIQLHIAHKRRNYV